MVNPARIASEESAGHSAPAKSKHGYVPLMSTNIAHMRTSVNMASVLVALHLLNSPDSRNEQPFVARFMPNNSVHIETFKAHTPHRHAVPPCRLMGAARPHRPCSLRAVLSAKYTSRMCRLRGSLPGTEPHHLLKGSA